MKFSVFHKACGNQSVVDVRPVHNAAGTFMMDCFLRSRTESGNPSNIEYDEEDVNVYIVNLLCLLADPVYYMQMYKYVADHDTDIFRMVENTTDDRLRYWVYKANADHLLVSLGLFGPRGEPARGPGGDSGPLSSKAARTDAGRGKTYYSFASCYCGNLAKRWRPLADVLCKLSWGFEKYVAILDHMRGEYFNILDVFSEGEIFHLQRELDQFKNRELIRKKYDVMLDLYLDWKKTKDPDLKVKMEAVLAELREIDPGCTFKIPQ
jgi:hypothetical protein